MSFFFVSQDSCSVTTVGTVEMDLSLRSVATSLYKLLAWMYYPFSSSWSMSAGAWRMYSMFFSDFSVYSVKS